MLKIKCAYFIKRFVITVLAVTMLISIEIAPDYPIVFVVVAPGMIAFIRILWISAKKDEHKLYATKFTLHHPKSRIRRKSRKAA